MDRSLENWRSDHHVPLFIQRRWKPIYSAVDHLGCENLQPVIQANRCEQSHRSWGKHRENIHQRNICEGQERRNPHICDMSKRTKGKSPWPRARTCEDDIPPNKILYIIELIPLNRSPYTETTNETLKKGRNRSWCMSLTPSRSIHTADDEKNLTRRKKRVTRCIWMPRATREKISMNSCSPSRLFRFTLVKLLTSVFHSLNLLNCPTGVVHMVLVWSV